LIDAEQAATRCPQCGGPSSECQDTDNQHAYVVTTKRCYRTAAHMAAQKSRTDTDGVMFVVTLDPSKKKSAQKKG
jgi:hypothetical protein